MTHNISLSFNDLDVEIEQVISFLQDKLEDCEITNSTVSTVELFIDLEVERVLETLSSLLEDLLDQSIYESVSVTIDIQIQKTK